MNKRIKKKYALENKVAQLTATNVLLMDAVKRHTKLIEKLYQTNSRNVKATNERFDAVETYQKILEDDIADLKKSRKKKFLKRK
ncbi:hypothetical protein [Streptococcus thoraltensis]|uniref:hypothetical protein n=1 Tax=Streptococcus thoraltensis TaxID=55085 RepID=UPI000381823E|nr:hypothetical protein [Streptococcus thoraltensis]QBX31115.1 hypothetical protein Javan616_0022 [Streptococcus phage Javan616]